MKKKITTILSAVLLICGVNLSAQHQKTISFTARLNAEQETPAVISNAVGVAHLVLTPNLDTLFVRVDYTGLQSPFSAAHIHVGALGVAGAVVFPLPAPVNNTIKTIITGASLTPAVIANLFTSNYYVNIHSTIFTNGELRGQIVPEADLNFSCILNATQETPVPTNPIAFGVASFTLAKHTGALSYNVVVNNLSGPIQSGHIHKGIAGVAGPVLSTLTLTGNDKFSGTVDPTPFLTALFTDSLYINVHTAANANGEARGQIRLLKGLGATSLLNGKQEAPAVTTKATGVGAFYFSTDLDSIFIAVAMDSLSGPVTSAHLHSGVVGVSGPDILTLTTGITSSGNGITFAGAVTPAIVNSIIKDGVYINAHTAANPNGEIRGQVVPLARYTGVVCLSGDQEVPVSLSAATGGGIVSVSRDWTNAHVMYVASGLSSAVTSTHIHQGLTGVSGGILYTLTPSYINNGVFTYLKNTDVTPFTPAAALQQLKDSLYVNIHTSTFVNGEIRGQIGKDCKMVPTGINDLSLDNVSIYPNPATNELNIQLPANASEKTTIKVYDAIGKMIIDQQYNSTALINLNISGFTKGLYVIQVISGTQVFQNKFSKN